jgi:5'-nucleotidase
MLNILVTNDDGILAPGILALRDALSAIAKVTVVAPDVDGSGLSSSLSLNVPFRLKQIEKDFYALRGTPTDCVHAVISGLLPIQPDIVISGINNSANLGDDIIYSGTVSAAFEGRHLTYPSIALSMVSGSNQPLYETGTKVCIELLEKLLTQSYRHYGVLNVNIPNIPYQELKGIKITQVGRRGPPQMVQKGVDPRGAEYYWMGARGKALNADDETTDFYAVEHQYVSVSPLSLNYTDFVHFERMQKLFL